MPLELYLYKEGARSTPKLRRNQSSYKLTKNPSIDSFTSLRPSNSPVLLSPQSPVSFGSPMSPDSHGMGKYARWYDAMKDSDGFEEHGPPSPAYTRYPEASVDNAISPPPPPPPPKRSQPVKTDEVNKMEHKSLTKVKDHVESAMPSPPPKAWTPFKELEEPICPPADPGVPPVAASKASDENGKDVKDLFNGIKVKRIKAKGSKAPPKTDEKSAKAEGPDLKLDSKAAGAHVRRLDLLPSQVAVIKLMESGETIVNSATSISIYDWQGNDVSRNEKKLDMEAVERDYEKQDPLAAERQGKVTSRKSSWNRFRTWGGKVRRPWSKDEKGFEAYQIEIWTKKLTLP